MGQVLGLPLRVAERGIFIWAGNLCAFIRHTRLYSALWTLSKWIQSVTVCSVRRDIQLRISLLDVTKDSIRG